MFCSTCGNQIGQNTKFCPKCGDEAPSVVPAVPNLPKANSKAWTILLIAPLVIIGLIAWAVISSSSQQARLEKAYEKDPSLRPAPVVERPRTPAEKCADIHEALKDKRIGDLTVRESEALQACRSLGL
jgi:hypothetical protein